MTVPLEDILSESANRHLDTAAQQLAAQAAEAHRLRLVEEAKDRRSRINFTAPATASTISAAPASPASQPTRKDKFSGVVARFEQFGHDIQCDAEKTIIHDQQGKPAFEIVPETGVIVLTKDEVLIRQMVLEVLKEGGGKIEATGEKAFREQIKKLAATLHDELSAARIPMPITVNGEVIEMSKPASQDAEIFGALRPQAKVAEAASLRA